jgi:hypothetical protein
MDSIGLAGRAAHIAPGLFLYGCTISLLNMPERNKDGPKARHDLIVLRIRKDLQGGCERIEDDDDDHEEEMEGCRKGKGQEVPRISLPAGVLHSKSRGGQAVDTSPTYP